MEEDREKREVLYGRITPAVVLGNLRARVADGEVMFTSGEPTLNKNLPTYIRWARQLGYRRIGLTTNARRLSYEPYARRLLDEGLNLIVVSIHGPDARCHDGQTRTPGSFAQTLEGLRVLARLKQAYSFRIHTSTVVGKRNYRRFADMYALLASLSVDEIVFNVMQPLGRAERLVTTLVARYSDIVREFGTFLSTVSSSGPALYLVDLPLCTTEGLPAPVRGYVESATFHEPTKDGTLRLQATRQCKEEKNRVKRPECDTCRYGRECLGVWRAYVEVYGWDEFVPVRMPTSPPRSANEP